MANIGIIVRHQNDKSRKIEAELLRRGHSVYYYPIDMIVIRISSSIRGYDHAYWVDDGTRLVYPDCAIWRAGGSSKSGLHLLRFLLMKGIPCTHTPNAIRNCADKFRTHVLMSFHKGIRNPQTHNCTNLLYWLNVSRKVGYPQIIKEPVGSQGIGVYVIPNVDAAAERIEQMRSDGKKRVLFQEFIKTGNDKNVEDYRIFIVKNEITAIMKRMSFDGSKKANLSLGGVGVISDLSEENKTQALEAAKAAGMNNSICGVDMLIDSEGIGYVCEVNSNPGLKIMDYTKINVAGKIADFAESLANIKDDVNGLFNLYSDFYLSMFLVSEAEEINTKELIKMFLKKQRPEGSKMNYKPVSHNYESNKHKRAQNIESAKVANSDRSKLSTADRAYYDFLQNKELQDLINKSSSI